MDTLGSPCSWGTSGMGWPGQPGHPKYPGLSGKPGQPVQTPCSLSSPIQWDHLTSLLSQGLPYRGLSLDRLATQIDCHRPQLEHLHVAGLVQEYADDNAYVRGHGTEGIVSLLDITKVEASTIWPFKLHFW